MPLGSGLLLIGLFTAGESRTAKPLLPLGSLRRSNVGAVLAGMPPWASFFALIYQMTLFVQQVLGYTPLAAGSSGLTIAVVSLTVSARLAGPVSNRIGAGATLAGGLGRSRPASCCSRARP